MTKKAPNLNDGSAPGAVEFSNVDQAEIAKFEAAAGYWWDRSGPLKALHDINPLRLGYIEDRAGGLAGKRVLDVGCGGGLLSEAMARRSAEVTGIDMGASPLAVAEAHRRRAGLEIAYIRATAEAFAETHPAEYDVVTCLELLEHVPRPDSVVTACRNLVKPGGEVFFATINRNPKAFLLAILAAEYLLGFVPRGTHAYRNFIKPAELTAWAEAAGLVRADLTGMHYNPFSRRYTLGGNHHVNYLIHFRRSDPSSG